MIEKAQEAGIPLIAVDDTILDADGKPAPFVGFDAASAGLKVGELIGEYYEAEGWGDLSDAVIKGVSVEDQDLEVCNLRTDGATSVLIELASNGRRHHPSALRQHGQQRHGRYGPGDHSQPAGHPLDAVVLQR